MVETKQEKATTVLYVDDIESEIASGIPFCRICHEIEFESCKTLEAPCSCSGTVKFAHRDCIQRWCEEKGDTTCEICLQKFEPGYTAPVEKGQLVDAAVTIRGSLQVPTRRGQGNSDLEEQLIQSDFSSNRWNCFRIVALIFTILFLLRNVFTLLIGGTEHYQFALLTLLIAKTSGIVLPIYVMIRIVVSICNSCRNRHQYEAPGVESSSESGGDEEAEAEAEDRLEHRVEIHSS